MISNMLRIIVVQRNIPNVGSLGNTIISSSEVMYLLPNLHATRIPLKQAPSTKLFFSVNSPIAAQQAVLDTISEGVTGEYLNQQSENVLMASPYGEFMGKGLGHGVGLEVHESPFMNRDCPLIIEKGCVITVESGIYIPDWGGVRIEDDVVLTDEGLKILSSSPKELLEL